MTWLEQYLTRGGQTGLKSWGLSVKTREAMSILRVQNMTQIEKDLNLENEYLFDSQEKLLLRRTKSSPTTTTSTICEKLLCLDVADVESLYKFFLSVGYISHEQHENVHRLIKRTGDFLNDL